MPFTKETIIDIYGHEYKIIKGENGRDKVVVAVEEGAGPDDLAHVQFGWDGADPAEAKPVSYKVKSVGGLVRRLLNL
jgi:hypothetical protein